MNCDLNQLMPGESLVGYLVRKAFINSHKSTENYAVKKANKVMLKPFPFIDDQELLVQYSMSHILTTATPYSVIRLYESTPVILQAINRIKGKPVGGKNDVRLCSLTFCGLCMEKQVYEFGFAWLKNEWLLPGYQVCHVHELDLLQHNCGCDAYSLPLKQVMSNVLKGFCDKCSENIWVQHNDSELVASSSFERWLCDLATSNSYSLSTIARDALTEVILSSFNPPNNFLKGTYNKQKKLDFPDVWLLSAHMAYPNPKEFLETTKTMGRAIHINIQNKVYIEESFLLSSETVLESGAEVTSDDSDANWLGVIC